MIEHRIPQPGDLVMNRWPLDHPDSPYIVIEQMGAIVEMYGGEPGKERVVTRSLREVELLCALTHPGLERYKGGQY